jgi:glycerol-3-phosphate dehydrogenase
MLPSLHRDLARLAADTFDVLVIGGGIYGLTIAYDAAQRGLTVALVERHDFGSGNTFNHLRTIHGGLRYLQTLDLGRARESIRERRTLARIAPWALAVTPFVLPLTHSLMKGRLAMRAGFALDALVSLGRNDGVPDDLRLPHGYLLGPNEAVQRYPELAGTEMTGAAVWHDYLTSEPERLTFSWAIGAAIQGAALANYVEARALTSAAGVVTGARVVDRLTDCTFDITARTVVNATGSRLNLLLAPQGAEVLVPLMRAMNLVSARPAPGAALGGRSRSGRNLFLVPWRGRALFGTWESPFTVGPDDEGVRPEDVGSFVSELNEAFPSFRLTESDITLVHHGVVPALVSMEFDPELDGRELIFEHRAEGFDGAISVAGTKYTTARAVAEHVVDRLYPHLARPFVESRSDQVSLPHVQLSGPALLEHAAANEMVVSLADAVLRRTPIGSLGRPDERTLTQAASIVGRAQDWPESRQHEEIAAVRRLY